MKKIFPEFYRLSNEEFQKVWDECIFVFDANALLNLYRYPRNICDEFIKILSDAKIKDRLWIPHQYAFEYQKNRLEVIVEQEHSYKRLLEKIENLIKEFERHPFLNMKNVMEPAINKIKSSATEHPKWRYNDPIRDTITDLFANKVGKPFSVEEIKDVSKVGEERYNKKTPPGYLDIKKGEDAKYGDLIGWMQIMNQAKTIKKPIVFITSETDEDWWRKIKGEIVDPRYELIKEIKDYAGVFFCMYDWRLFHKRAVKYLQRETNKKIEDEINEVTKKITESGETKNISFADMVTPSEAQRILSEDVGRSSASQGSE